MKTISLDPTKVNAVYAGELPATTKVGYVANADGTFDTLFCAVNKETGEFELDKNNLPMYRAKPQLKNRRAG